MDEEERGHPAPAWTLKIYGIRNYSGPGHFCQGRGELLKACMLLAVEMQKKKVREIPEQNLQKLVAAFPGIEKIESIDVKGRSLLNKNSDGDFRFSHYSIQEFLVVKYIRENPEEELRLLTASALPACASPVVKKSWQVKHQASSK